MLSPLAGLMHALVGLQHYSLQVTSQAFKDRRLQRIEKAVADLAVT